MRRLIHFRWDIITFPTSLWMERAAPPIRNVVGARMEPFHQLRFSRDTITDIDAELESLGIVITHEDDSWLGPKYSEYRSLMCERDNARSGFAIGPDPADDGFTLLVYVNMLDDHLTAEICAHLESRGAEWGYFDS